MLTTRSASGKAYQLLAHSRWFSPGTPASSTTKTGRHEIAKILLKVTLNTINHYTIEDKIHEEYHSLKCDKQNSTILINYIVQ